jgi:hypothetical protein
MSEPPTGAPYRSAIPGRQLALPPRRVPARLRALLCFGGGLAPFGWLFFTIGSVIAWVLGAQADWSSLTVHGPYDHLTAEVIRTEVDDSTKINGRHPVAVHFRYVVDDVPHEGVSYTEHDVPRVGGEVSIEVPGGHLDQAVIEGMRRRSMPLFIVVVVLVFPIVGLGLAAYRLRSGLREIRLLTIGRLAHGKLVHREDTNVTINNDRVEKLSFDFETRNGRVQRAIVRTHRPEKLTDEPLEPLLYDPAMPARAALLDALPGTPRLDAAGELVFDRSPWSLFAALALPALAVLVNLVAPFVVFALR